MNTTEEIYNNLSDEVLAEVENMASLFFKPRDICVSIGWPAFFVDEFEEIIRCMDIDNPLYQAYQRGRLQTEIELRESIRQAAANGSNPAQTTLIQFYNNSKIQ